MEGSNMNLTQEQQQERTARGPLVEALKQAGAVFRGDACTCPLHEDKHPSARVKQGQDGVWRLRCFAASCGFSGDVYDLRSKLTGKSIGGVLTEARGHINRQTKPQKSTNREPKPQAKQADGEKPKRYVSIEAVTQRLPGLEGVWAWPGYDNEITCWTLRYRPPGKSKKYIQVTPCKGGVILKGPEPPYVLLNLRKVQKAEMVIIVEGEPKVDIIEQIGLEGVAATSTLGGAGPKKEFLTDWQPVRGKVIYLWPDADPGGIDFMLAIAERLWALYPRPTIFWIEPAALGLSGKEDVVDYLRDIAEDRRRRKLLEAMDAAEPWKSSRPTLAAGVRENTEAIVSGKLADVSLPFYQLQTLSRVTAPGIISLLAGPGGSIKTWLLLRWGMTWFEQNISFAYLGLEEDRTYCLERIQAMCEQNIELLNPDWVKAHPDEKRAADDRQESYLHAIGQSLFDAPNEAMSLREVVEWVRRRARERRRLVVVDPVTAVDPVKDCYIADRKFITEIKTIARLSNTTIILATHRRKGGKGFGLDDICGGAAYSQLTQCILWVEPHRPPKDVTALSQAGRSQATLSLSIHISKARKAPGVGKTVGICIDWPSVTFSEAGIVLKG
jgi:hypothetical protein